MSIVTPSNFFLFFLLWHFIFCLLFRIVHLLLFFLVKC
nr:MAG TPA: hypothetical protein [Caudoviricetes sp.]